MVGEQHDYTRADYMWVKVNKRSWWPAQVVDQNTVSKKCLPKRKIIDGTLVRLYGTYVFFYVDTVKYRQEFKNVLRQNSCAREEFQKALEKLTCRIPNCSNSSRNAEVSTGVGSAGIGGQCDTKTNLPNQSLDKAIPSKKEKTESHLQNIAKKWKASRQNEVDPPTEGQKMNRAQNSEKQSKRKHTEDLLITMSKQHGTKELKKADTLKDNSSENKGQVGAQVQMAIAKRSREVKEKAETPESTRRIKVMQNLGLIAPCGSPFKKEV